MSDEVSADVDALLHRAVEAFNAGDLDVVMDAYHPDASASPPEGWPEGPTSDRDEVRRQFERLLEVWRDQRLELLERRQVGDLVLVHMIWHTRGRASEAEVDFDLWHLFRFRDDRVARHEFHWSRADALRAAGASG